MTTRAADQLKRLFTAVTPFGPIDHADINYAEAANADICRFVAPLRGPIEAHSAIVIGRKGSGKSTYISTFEMGTRLKERLKSEGYVTSLPASEKQLVMSIRTWRLFNEIVRHLKTVELASHVPVSLILPEQVEEYWVELLWDKIIERVYEHLFERSELSNYHGIREYFVEIPLRHLKTDRTRSSTTPPPETAILNAAIRDVMNFLHNSNRQLVIALDNFEKYPVRTQEFQIALQGFVSAVVHFSRHVPDRSDKIKIVFAFPEEIERVITTTESAYSNVLKDTQRSTRIRWTAAELWTVALHRYRIFLQHNDKFAFKMVEGFDINKREGRRKFFNVLFQGDVINKRGNRERSDAYIIRHTQLLPRHLLTLMNGIVSRSTTGSGDTIHIDSNLIIKGVSEKEDDVAKDILTPYAWLFPEFLSGLRPVLSDLNSMFTYGEFDRMIPRIHADGGLPFDISSRAQTWEILYGMGIIGMEIQRDHTRKYVETLFHFNERAGEGRLHLGSQRKYCFHPLFSQYYGVIPPDGNDYCVYPSGVDSMGSDSQ